MTRQAAVPFVSGTNGIKLSVNLVHEGTKHRCDSVARKRALVGYKLGSIGNAVATRAIMADLRAGMDGVMGGPAPFAKADRSRFLQALDEALVRMG